MELKSLKELWEETKAPFTAEQILPSKSDSEFINTPQGTIASGIELNGFKSLKGTFITPDDPENERNILFLDQEEKIWKKLR